MALEALSAGAGRNAYAFGGNDQEIDPSLLFQTLRGDIAAGRPVSLLADLFFVPFFCFSYRKWGRFLIGGPDGGPNDPQINHEEMKRI